MKLKLYLLITILANLFSFGQTFSSGGINYFVTSATAPYTVAVGTNTNFSGAAVIPETVDDNGITYSVTSFVNEAFLACGGLTSIIIPNSVTSIGSSAFQACVNLTNVTLSNSLTSISHYSFYYCTALTSITIPDSVTSIGQSSFDYCSSLASVNIPNSVTYLDAAFMECTGLTSITLPNSITTITGFRNCTSLTSLNIPSSVNSIGPGAFEGCSGLTSIIIPNSVTSIGESAFVSCSSLTSLNIPSSVTSIGSRAFRSCTGLTSVTVNWLTPLAVPNQTFFTLPLGNIILNVPNGTVAAYQAAPVWQNFNITPPPVAATYLNFDGVDDHIIISNESNFDFTNQMTVEFWMKSSVTPDQGDALVTKGSSSWSITLTDTGKITFLGNNAFTQFTSNAIVTDGNWHHVAVTYDSSNYIAKIYIDGNLDATTSGFYSIDTNNIAVSIGSNIETTNQFYNGDLDDIRIWNNTRTETAINSVKDCALIGNEFGLVAYYKLNQGISTADNTAITTVVDATAYANNGMLQNFSLNGNTSNFLAEAAPVTNITYTLVQNNVSCNGLSDSSIIVTPSGGQAPYTFSWSTGSTSGMINNYPAGTVINFYSITDANGCFIGSTNFGIDGNTLQAITITQPAALGSPTVITPVVYNQGANASALTATVGTNGTSLLWYTTATGGNSDTTAPTPSTANPGNTSYWVSSTNTNGCESARTEIVVTVNASVTASCWSQITTGLNHTVAIAQNGTLWAWGLNDYGQLGLGDTTNRTIPTQVGTETDWQSVSCGGFHTLAIKTNGSLWAWGYNAFGQLGRGSTTSSFQPTAIDVGTTWQSVSGGTYHSVGIRTSGYLYSWGDNTYGQLGRGNNSQILVPAFLGSLDTDWQSISCGVNHTVALKTNGTLWSCGDSFYGQLGLGDNNERNTLTQVGTDTDWQSCSTRGDQTIAIKTNGALWAWGYNFYGQLGLGDIIERNTPNQVGTDTNWQSVSSGFTFTTAIKTNGTLWSCGYNSQGQLGLGDTTDRNTLTQVGTATNWQSTSTGTAHALAFKTDGVVWSWGRNIQGQLGLDDTTDRNTPVIANCPTVLLSIDDFISKNNVTIYPNPSNGIFTIISQEESTIEVYDMIGKKVESKKVAIGSSTLDLSNYTNGMYLLMVTSQNGGSNTYKIVKQ